MPKTLCPACGFSPIAPGAEECPSCGEPFAFLQTHKKAKNKFIDPMLDPERAESTTFGGAVTGAVTAHPYPPAIAFLTGAAVWFLRGSGVLVDLSEPAWTFAAAAVDLLVPVILIVNLGPAKLLAQLAALGQLGLAAFLGKDDLANPVHLLYAAHAATLLVMVTGEPGVFRRALGLSLAAATAAAGAAVLGLIGMRVSVSELGGQAQGFKLRLPPGYVAFTREELQSALHVPAGEPVPFGNPVERVYGLVLTRRSATPLIAGCEALGRELGGAAELKPLSHPAPVGMGPSALVYPLKSSYGATGRLACAKRGDGKFAAFAVVLSGVDPSLADAASERAFDELGAGLTVY